MERHSRISSTPSKPGALSCIPALLGVHRGQDKRTGGQCRTYMNPLPLGSPPQSPLNGSFIVLMPLVTEQSLLLADGVKKACRVPEPPCELFFPRPDLLSNLIQCRRSAESDDEGALWLGSTSSPPPLTSEEAEPQGARATYSENRV